MNKQYVDKIVNLMKAEDMDAVLVCPSEELKFLVGFSPMMCERFQGLFIKKDGDAFYLCNSIYTGELELVLGDTRILTWYDRDFMEEAVHLLLADEGLHGSIIGVNSSAPGFCLADISKKSGITFVNARPLLEEMRIIKSAEELESLRISSSIADKVFADVIKFVKPGMKEAQIKEFVLSELVRHGGSNPWALIASGVNSSFPHYRGDSRTVEAQDVILFDFGCAYNDMCSDISRMVFVGTPTDEQKKIYEICRASTEAGEAACFEGAFIPDIEKVSRAVIEEAGYGEFFTTRLGHGIGFMGHEAPDIKLSNPRKLEKGMSFTIEPGINLPGKFGMRVEDVVAITENGTEILNKATHEMVVV